MSANSSSNQHVIASAGGSNSTPRPSSSNGKANVPSAMSKGVPIRSAPSGGAKAGGGGGGGGASNLKQPGPAQATASRLDKQKHEAAADIIKRVKEQDKAAYPKDAKNPEVRFGGRFIHNRPYIEKTSLYKVAQMAPKGAHLHIHLNACLGPDYLLTLAAHKDFENNMYISTNLQDPEKAAKVLQQRKTNKQARNSFPEPLTRERLDRAKIQFHFLPKGWPSKSLFAQDYCGRIGATEKAEDRTYDVMRYGDFLRQFNRAIHGGAAEDVSSERLGGTEVMRYLKKRLVFQPEDVVFQKKDINDKTPGGSVKRQWAMFDTRTQMMKGLFMAETAYRKYLYSLFSSFNADKIQYAELRPNFMAANSVIRTPVPDRQSEAYKKGAFAYDPSSKMDNKGIMNMIIDTFEAWKKANPTATFKGMKVIVCTPRSPFYPMKFVATTMQECYDMKQDAKFGPYIAGFDFIGPEHEGRKLSQFNTETNPETQKPWNLLNKWREPYRQAGIEWLLHCGESLRDDDGNLDVAVHELHAKRLSHGYAIPAKPQILKALSGAGAGAGPRAVCVDTCPDSNEDLGLYCGAEDAVAYKLMAAGIPCSVSCDNPTLFQSTLSHEFYQIMVGQENFGLAGWRKLMMDSIKHSVWNKENPQAPVQKEWERQYEMFIDNIIKSKDTLLKK